MVTISQVISRLHRVSGIPRIATPPYVHNSLHGEASNKVALAVESMKDHMTDEGWQIMLALQETGYILCGQHLPLQSSDLTSIPRILSLYNPGILVVQDKREWDVKVGDFRDSSARFTEIEALKDRHDIFKLTIIKDAQQRPIYHRQSAEEMGVHAWIHYYHPQIVAHLAPYVRPQHLIRTYHTIDTKVVPYYNDIGRYGCLISGAVSGSYPLRQRLVNNVDKLYQTTYMGHPGYHRKGCATPEFLKQLTHYKVAICTASMYGYTLRKLVEATAAGCVVVTDLPVDEVMPQIDANLIRVDPNISIPALNLVLTRLCEYYDEHQQYEYAQRAKLYYDYRSEGFRLAQKIEDMRRGYKQ